MIINEVKCYEVCIYPGGGGLIFAGYVPLASHSPVTHYSLFCFQLLKKNYLNHFCANVILAIPT